MVTIQRVQEKLCIIPSMFGLCRVRPGAGGCDVRVWDGAILHPQGVTTLSCRGKMKGRRGGEKDRDMSNILICMEKMSGGNLIFPLECRQPSLVTEHNVVMSSLGKLPDFMLHNLHRHWREGEKIPNNTINYCCSLICCRVPHRFVWNVNSVFHHFSLQVPFVLSCDYIKDSH